MVNRECSTKFSTRLVIYWPEYLKESIMIYLYCAVVTSIIHAPNLMHQYVSTVTLCKLQIIHVLDHRINFLQVILMQFPSC